MKRKMLSEKELEALSREKLIEVIRGCHERLEMAISQVTLENKILVRNRNALRVMIREAKKAPQMSGFRETEIAKTQSHLYGVTSTMDALNRIRDVLG